MQLFVEGVTWYLYVIMSTKDIFNALNVYFTCLEEFYIYLSYNLQDIKQYCEYPQNTCMLTSVTAAKGVFTENPLSQVI